MEEIKTEQKESIKLSKMSKGYQWEIKIHIEGCEDNLTIGRLKAIDEQLKKEYERGLE